MDLTSEAHVFVDPNRITLELGQRFGLTIEDLQDVARTIYRAFVQVSALHPKGYDGTSGWAEGTVQLRATMIPKGWRPDDPKGQPRVASRDGALSITLSSGNAHTGVPNRVPQTRNDKGTQTASSVHFNARQGLLFPIASADGQPEPLRIPKGGALWILLYYIDFDASEMRLELSQPTGMSDGAKINNWSIRYILPSMQFAPDYEEPRDESPDIDFDVTPKTL